MKFFIAGIDVSLMHMLKVNVPTTDILNSIAQIRKEAQESLGQDVIIIIVMQEYALTPTSIPNHKKKDLLAKFQAVIDQYDNIILVPGSFSAYEAFSTFNSEKKSKKIENLSANYTDLSDNALLENDPFFKDDYLKARQKIIDNKFDNALLLQNSGYLVIPRNKRIKHKKSYPHKEASKLKHPASQDAIFNIGNDNPIKTITINNTSFGIGFIICLEQHTITAQHPMVKNNLPLMVIIVSDTVDLNISNLFGAINIQMDSDSGLTVHFDLSHPLASSINPNEIRVRSYDLLSGTSKDIDVVHFNAPKPVLTPVTSSSSSVTSVPADGKEIVTSSNSEPKKEANSSVIRKGFFNPPAKKETVAEKKSVDKTEKKSEMKPGFLVNNNVAPSKKSSTGLKNGFLL